MYWDAVLTSKNLGIIECIKQAFWPFLDYGFNAASKTINFGLNVAFSIEILMNRIKIKLIFLKSEKKIANKKLAAFKSNLGLKTGY